MGSESHEEITVSAVEHAKEMLDASLRDEDDHLITAVCETWKWATRKTHEYNQTLEGILHPTTPRNMMFLPVMLILSWFRENYLDAVMVISNIEFDVKNVDVNGNLIDPDDLKMIKMDEKTTSSMAFVEKVMRYALIGDTKRTAEIYDFHLRNTSGDTELFLCSIIALVGSITGTTRATRYMTSDMREEATTLAGNTLHVSLDGATETKLVDMMDDVVEAAWKHAGQVTPDDHYPVIRAFILTVLKAMGQEFRMIMFGKPDPRNILNDNDTDTGNAVHDTVVRMAISVATGDTVETANAYRDAEARGIDGVIYCLASVVKSLATTILESIRGEEHDREEDTSVRIEFAEIVDAIERNDHKTATQLATGLVRAYRGIPTTLVSRAIAAAAEVISGPVMAEEQRSTMITGMRIRVGRHVIDVPADDPRIPTNERIATMMINENITGRCDTMVRVMQTLTTVDQIVTILVSLANVCSTKVKMV